jgi:hypothetical protein
MAFLRARSGGPETTRAGLGRAFDQLIDAGATCIFEETGELVVLTDKTFEPVGPACLPSNAVPRRVVAIASH